MTLGNPEVARIGIVTVSDRASRGEYEDRGGPALVEYFTEVMNSQWEAVLRVVPDERPHDIGVDRWCRHLGGRDERRPIEPGRAP